MCIAIASKKNTRIPKKYLAEGFKNNPHGAGYIYVEKGVVKIEKGFFSFRSFWKSFRPHQEKACVVHFRWATHGEKNKENCHPFSVIENTLAFVHNGQIHAMPKHDTFSDTHQFNEIVLKSVVYDRHDIINQKGFQFLMEEAIGAGSKLVFLNKSEDMVIVNEKAGEWINEIWYSNCTYKQPRYTQNSFVHQTYYYGQHNKHVAPVVHKPAATTTPTQLALPAHYSKGVGGLAEDISPYHEWLDEICESVSDEYTFDTEGADGSFLTKEDVEELQMQGFMQKTHVTGEPPHISEDY